VVLDLYRFDSESDTHLGGLAECRAATSIGRIGLESLDLSKDAISIAKKEN
jgi:hypothetical protein